jgi:hypothetical protein
MRTLPAFFNSAVGTEIFLGATRGLTVSTKRYSHVKTLQMSLEFDTDIHISAVHDLCLFENTPMSPRNKRRWIYTTTLPITTNYTARHQTLPSKFFMNWTYVPCSMLQNYCILAKTLQSNVTGIACTGFPHIQATVIVSVFPRSSCNCQRGFPCHPSNGASFRLPGGNILPPEVTDIVYEGSVLVFWSIVYLTAATHKSFLGTTSPKVSLFFLWRNVLEEHGGTDGRY